MIIHSDWHIHSENSYDAINPITTIGDNANAQGLRSFGITDHANLNDDKFRKNIEDSAQNVKVLQTKYPNMILGVELTTVKSPCMNISASTAPGRVIFRLTKTVTWIRPLPIPRRN